MHRPVLALVGIVAVLGLASCGDGGANGPSRPGLTLTLRDPGAEPRLPLRYALEAGAKRSYRMTQVATMSMGALPKPVTTTSSSSLELEVLSVRPDGGADVRCVASASTVESSLVGSAQTVPGSRVRGVLTPRGEFRDFELEFDAADADAATRRTLDRTAPALKEAFEKMGVMLPDAPVGVGARWAMSGTVTSMGLSFDTHADVTLEARDGDVVRLATAITMRAGAQTFSMPGSPMSLDLTSAEASGTATHTCDLRAPGSAGTTTVRMKLSMKAPKTPSDGKQPPRELPAVDLDATIEQKVERAD